MYKKIKTILTIIIIINVQLALFAGEKIYLKKSQIIFGDGDTFTANGVVIRFLGVDTPETKNPEHGFSTNQYLGQEASEFTKRKIQQAKSIYYIPYKTDRYGRTLAHVFVDNELLSAKIIEAGLGYETITTYKENGFPEIEKQILTISEKVGKPNFTNPMHWRNKQRRKQKNNEK